jgi:hypothetical protein
MDGMQSWPIEAVQYIQKLEQRIQKLEAELQKMKADFEEYKKRHPPNVGVKDGKPYAFKSNSQSQNPKKPGAKPGHKPYFRPVPDHIDIVRRVSMSVCPECGGVHLSKKAQQVRTRIYEDISVSTPVVVQLEIERWYCRTCKKLVEAPVTWVLPRARFSLRTMLIVTWLKVHLRMTEEAIPEMLVRLFGLKLSEGEVIHMLAQVARAFGPYYEQLIQDIRDAPARNIDETTWRINGKNMNLWAFVTQGETLYKIASSRSHTVPLNVLGKKHNGVDIHDRFAAYRTLAQKTKNIQQDCWTHIIKNAEELAHFHGEEGAQILQVAKDTYASAKTYDHKGTDEDIETLFQSMSDAFNRPYKSSHCHRFVVNLLNEKDNLFEFVRNPHVDGTNNRAERAIRPPVTARKIMGGNRSEQGARNYEILLSVTQTLHQNGQNLIDHGPAILLTSHG